MGNGRTFELHEQVLRKTQHYKRAGRLWLQVRASVRVASWEGSFTRRLPTKASSNRATSSGRSDSVNVAIYAVDNQQAVGTKFVVSILVIYWVGAHVLLLVRIKIYNKLMKKKVGKELQAPPEHSFILFSILGSFVGGAPDQQFVMCLIGSCDSMTYVETSHVCWSVLPACLVDYSRNKMCS